MNEVVSTLDDLYERVPRRHTAENVKEIQGLLEAYEDLLVTIEGESPALEKLVPPYFDQLEPIRLLVKKSNDNKAGKKLKDQLFDEASGAFKDSLQTLKAAYSGAA